MLAIETTGLTHRFGAETALRDVQLQVPDGSIYGFLGPNGAGKTTTLRLVLGLLRRQQGTIAVFGQPLERDRLNILRRVGSSIETPSVYGQLTAAENLEVWRRVFRCPRRRIAEVLSLVGLEAAGSKRAEQFSLGMKQRLSIAVALLHQPVLLILDEPTNGLDPHGILEMRALLTALNREHGVTVLVSSHILAEIEKVATHVGVIHRGTLTFQGTLAALFARQSAASVTRLDTSDNPRAIEIVRRAGLAPRVEEDRVAVRALTRDEAGRLTSALVAGGIVIYEIATVRRDLEDVFLELIGGETCG
jgi:lantibiotic transport system ATP-binding protein